MLIDEIKNSNSNFIVVMGNFGPVKDYNKSKTKRVTLSQNEPKISRKQT